VQRAKEALADVGMMDEMQALVGRPGARPYQRFREVRVALAIDKGEAQDPQAESVTELSRYWSLLTGARARPGASGNFDNSGGLRQLR
jgi:predicted MarR family transcription regulator